MAAAAAQPTPEQIAQQFVTFFYQTFDSVRANLASLYKDESTLTLGDQPAVRRRDADAQ